MSAITVHKRLILRIAFFAVGAVVTFLVLETSGVQRVSSWIILAGWLLPLAGFAIFGNRRTR